MYNISVLQQIYMTCEFFCDNNIKKTALDVVTMYDIVWAINYYPARGYGLCSLDTMCRINVPFSFSSFFTSWSWSVLYFKHCIEANSLNHSQISNCKYLTVLSSVTFTISDPSQWRYFTTRRACIVNYYVKISHKRYKLVQPPSRGSVDKVVQLL